ncbi:extracellular solute-binding protein [Alcaligenaceae bacterium SJ-26]|nr:extracellular solute-binding protein [Alcaligenaceae bacterium SJ-26]
MRLARPVPVLRQGAAGHARTGSHDRGYAGHAGIPARAPAYLRLKPVRPRVDAARFSAVRFAFTSVITAILQHRVARHAFPHKTQGGITMAFPFSLRQVCFLSATACLAFGASAKDLTVVNFGGANGNAQKTAYVDTFEKATGNRIIGVEYNGEQARVKAMVEAGNVTWDVVEVETGDLTRGCDEGLYQRIDWSRVGDKADFIPEAVTECGVGTFVWSTVLAYDADKLKTAPTSWADFWDIEKFPGKRGMRKQALYNLEFALMADGVPAKDVYEVLATKEGVDRAFKKLDELKPHIQWWEAGAQPPQFLVAGDVVMSTAFNGRIDAARREGRPLAVAWNGGIYDLDYWVIPEGTPNTDLAYDFIKHASQPENQTVYAQNIAYGPVNVKALENLDAKVLADLPSAPANASVGVLMNGEFWTDHGEELQQRFTAWAAR